MSASGAGGLDEGTLRKLSGVTRPRLLRPVRCEATGKLRFATHDEAVAELAHCEFLRRRLGQVYRQERGVYLCPDCAAWHLTSHPQSD